MYFYNARYYDGALGRFTQADSIVPGAASGSGGGAATLGYDSNTRLTPLTVNLGEFATQVNAENREVLQFGAFFQWDSKTRQEHNVPMGPANPQALNRYAYCLNNPLRYVDPTGHASVPPIAEVQLNTDAWGLYSAIMTRSINELSRRGRNWGIWVGLGAGTVAAVLTMETGAFCVAIGAFVGGASGVAAERIAGGAQADELTKLQDWITIAVADLSAQGITDFTIKMSQADPLSNVNIWIEYNQRAYTSVDGESEYSLPFYAANDLYGIFSRPLTPGVSITYAP